MSKKATKDKSVDSTTYSANDVVLAKLRGFPPWPAQVVSEDNIPPQVLKERPAGKKTKFHCVRFFPAGDFSWSIAKDLSLLHKHEIDAYINEPHKKSGELLEGYKVALDPEKWLEEKEAERKAAEKEEDDAEVDQLEGEEEDGEGSKKSKKRKREGEGKSKPKKANGTTTEKKKKTSSKKEPKSDGVESEDEAGATKAPANKRAKKDKAVDKEAESDDPQAKKVKEWRHALQRVFLNKTLPKAEEMPQHEKLFTEVEQYEGLTVEHLQHSKIGKVMRHIAALEPSKVPRDDEFKIRDRANALVEKWHKIVGTTTEANGDVSKMDVDPVEPAANGAEE